MKLSAVFRNVAHKELVGVDLPDLGSNQHELNGVGALKEFFGTTGSTQGKLQWRYFADDQEPSRDESDFTFYDARAKSRLRTGRTEWRFYYSGAFLARASVGDWFFLARTESGTLLALVFQMDSAWSRAAQALFGISTSSSLFSPIEQEALRARNVELLQRQILDELNLDIPLAVKEEDAEVMTKRYGRIFPSTKEMSAFARTQVEVDLELSDATLLRWLEREEQLFRALEDILIRDRLDAGFNTSNDFIEYSLSVQNRRKSRMGLALQNHLAEVFALHGLLFTQQARTEGNNRPDFLFPGQTEYHDNTFDPARLVMLGVKSTSKDRWRQLLVEADRIPAKHLCTLQPAISEKQIEEMRRKKLSLVIPAGLQDSYTEARRHSLLSVHGFIDYVRSTQQTVTGRTP